GAGFEVSAEGAGHEGTLILTDPIRTRFADGSPDRDYVTHTRDGVDATVEAWDLLVGSAEYHLRWQAPWVDAARINLYVSALAIDDSGFYEGDRYYSAYGSSVYALPGDADGDADVDLRDVAALQLCFSGSGPTIPEGCEYLDSDSDGKVTLADAADVLLNMTGPTAEVPAGYVMADAIRGGALYDKWWKVTRAVEPTQDHPLWALRPDQTSNTRSGGATWRCKECHGWDYKGVDGDYGTYGVDSHRTGFPGVFDTAVGAQELFDLLKNDDAQTAMGHSYGDAGLGDDDIWDLVRMTLEGVVDTDETIDPSGLFTGSQSLGDFFYQDRCRHCHGADGRNLNFGLPEDPVYLGTVANDNPWEFLHKVRYGHPGSAMGPAEIIGWSVETSADVGTFSQTLPTE
ncbi:MAG: hypothetical protein IIB60_04800, partial [Planctomycetes bacterium]|nr:hypothetical protein [Planctomycetota bacterium]